MSSSTSEYIKTKNISAANRGFVLSALDKVLNSTQDLIAQATGPVQSFGGPFFTARYQQTSRRSHASGFISEIHYPEASTACREGAD